MKSLTRILALSVLLVGWNLSLPAAAQDDHAGHNHGPGEHAHEPEHEVTVSAPIVESREPWSPEILRLFASLPVQDDGRIKPLDTLASFRLLKLNGMRSTKDLNEKRLTPMEWFLDCLFYPELAKKYKCFIVTTWEAPEAIGISVEGKKKRDRYSYEELAVGQDKLIELRTEYAKKEPKDRTAREQEIINLADNVLDFQFLIHHLDYGREAMITNTSPGLATLFPGASQVTLSGILNKATLLQQAYWALDSNTAQADPAKVEQEKTALADLLNTASNLSMRAAGLAIFPPTVPLQDLKTYVTPAEIVEPAFQLPNPPRQQIDWTASMEKLVQTRDDRATFTGELEKLHTSITGIADARGEYAKIPLEVFYYKSQFLYWSLVLFVMCFALVTVYWLKPQLAPVESLRNLRGVKKLLVMMGRSLHKGIPFVLLIPTLLLVAGITMRCIIRSRPPVSTLYETILFITACAVITALIAEWINRKRVAVSVAAILGSLGMFVAMKYEAKEAVDTMPSLVAVLDTNFWLSTHVTTVALGYSAGLFAAAIAHVYILGKLFGFKKNEPAFYKTVSRMTYGVICFGLLFSTLGTVLGGIWANDSWGRFWGWDPKENGALMICLWELAMLHGRMGGYLRDLGMAVTSVLCGMVVAFSWWGVNLLSVGLHSYGFTAGIFQYLMAFYGFELLIVLLAGLVWIKESMTSTQAENPQSDDSDGHNKKHGKSKHKHGKKEIIVGG